MDSFEDHCWQDVISADMLDLYKHYRRPVYVGDRPALVVIDLYEKAYQGGPLPVMEVAQKYPSSCGINAWTALEPTKALLAAARKASIPIFYTTGEWREDAKPGAVQSTNRKRTDWNETTMKIFDQVAPLSGEVVIAKQRASAFFGTPLSAHLTQLGIKSVIICGESTSGCVRASTVDAYSHGYHVTLVEECCFDRNDLSHKVNLFDLHHKYADVLHIDEVLKHLASLAA